MKNTGKKKKDYIKKIVMDYLLKLASYERIIITKKIIKKIL